MGHSDCEEVHSTLVSISVALWFLVIMMSCWFLPNVGNAFMGCWGHLEKAFVEGYEKSTRNATIDSFDPMHT